MARKRKQPEADNELRWLTTYGDVVTLLLAFFVMLYAISQVDQQKFQLFVSGLEDPFGNPATADGLLTDGTGLVGAAFDDEQAGDDGLEGIALLDGLPEVTQQDTEVTTTTLPPGQEGTATLETTEDLRQVRDAVSAALVDAGLGEVVDYDIDSRGLVIAIATDQVLFASGSAEFGDRGHDIIDVIAPTFLEFTNEILVEGHTDSVPITNRFGYDNWDLSVDRALAVLKYLTDVHGIQPERLAAAGFGEYRPKASNDTDQGKAMNRRVELVIVAERGE